MSRSTPSGQFSQYDGVESRASRYARVSIVLTSAEGAEELARCLEYVRPHRERLGAELVIVTRDDPASLRDLVRDVRLIAAPADAGIGDMRELGMRHASGDVVAVRADVDVGDASWLLELYAITGVALPPATEPVAHWREERPPVRAAVGAGRPRAVIPGLADLGPVEPASVVAPWERAQPAPPA
jgi:hypothetical protein